MSSPDPELLRTIRETPIAYGSWRRLKALYKTLEADPDADPVLLGTLISRLDATPLSVPAGHVPTFDTGLRHVLQIAIDGNGRLYALGGPRPHSGYGKEQIKVLQASEDDPFHPATLTTLDADTADGIAVGGACVLYRARGSAVALHRLSDTLLASAPASGDSGNCAVSYPFALVASVAPPGMKPTFTGLCFYELSAWDTPTRIAALEFPNLLGVAVHPERRLACILRPRAAFSWTQLPRAGGISLIDFNDPTRPKTVGALDLDEVRSIALCGDYAYVLCGGYGKGLYVIDISRPDRPVQQGFCRLDLPSAVAVTISRGFAYIAAGWQSSMVVDVRDPKQPRRACVVPTGNAQQIVVDGRTNRAYVRCIDNGNRVEIWNVAHPEKPVQLGTPPQPRTLGYMKRRARRLLRELAEQNPERYVRVATEMLRSQTEEIDPARHWVSMDTLFAGGGRYYQARHGRGHYHLRAGVPDRRIRLRIREERAPSAWDRYPEQAARLLTAPRLPASTYEMALRVMRANRVPLPEIPEETLQTLLARDTPLLLAVATRQLAERLAGLQDSSTDPALLADAYLLSGAKRRRQFEPLLLSLAAQEGDERRRLFAQHLFGRVSRMRGESESHLTRRQISALVLIARSFKNTIAIRDLIQQAPAFLAAHDPDLREWLERAARRSNPQLVTRWLPVLAEAPADQVEPVLAALAEGMQGQEFTAYYARELVHHPVAFVREAGWRMLAASSTPEALLRPLWLDLLESRVANDPAITAMSSPYALVTLGRSGITTAELAALLQERPFLVGLLSPASFRTIVQQVPTPIALRLAAVASDTQWETLRSSWLDLLQEGSGIMALWSHLESAVQEDESGTLAQRILNDAAFSETILRIEDAEPLLQIRDPAFGPVLARYLRHYEDRFGKGNSLLLEAAIHELPELRDWALGRVARVGMEMPFALRLMESEVPPSVAAGQTFFTTLPAGAEREPDYALALCDSPRPTVRAFGRAFIQGRWATLPHTEVLRSLFENSDPQIQAFVAELLQKGEESTVPEAPTAAFAGEVLRTRNRARKAKEIVKTQQAAEATLDTATLLTLARSRTPRDAEWALAELAKRALAGETIEGVAVDGVAGV